MIKMKKVKSHEDETYFIGSDDHCLVVQSGDKKSPKLWLSKSMIRWIILNEKNILNFIKNDGKNKVNFNKGDDKMKRKITKEQATQMLGLRMTVGKLSKQPIDTDLEKEVIEQWKKAGFIKE